MGKRDIVLVWFGEMGMGQLRPMVTTGPCFHLALMFSFRLVFVLFLFYPQWCLLFSGGFREFVFVAFSGELLK